MPVPNGRLLLVGDQGYGDTIQFARYIPMAAELCQEVVLGCSAEMGPLLSKMPGVAQYHHRWNEIPGHAIHCRLSSLPYLFQTRLDTIPAKVPYLHPDPARVAHWRPRLDRPAHPSERPPPVGPARAAAAARGCRVGGLRLPAEADAGT